MLNLILSYRQEINNGYFFKFSYILLKYSSSPHLTYVMDHFPLNWLIKIHINYNLWKSNVLRVFEWYHSWRCSTFRTFFLRNITEWSFWHQNAYNVYCNELQFLTFFLGISRSRKDESSTEWSFWHQNV